jgi:hypothetical protein
METLVDKELRNKNNQGREGKNIFIYFYIVSKTVRPNKNYDDMIRDVLSPMKDSNSQSLTSKKNQNSNLTNEDNFQLRILNDLVEVEKKETAEGFFDKDKKIKLLEKGKDAFVGSNPTSNSNSNKNLHSIMNKLNLPTINVNNTKNDSINNKKSLFIPKHKSIFLREKSKTQIFWDKEKIDEIKQKFFRAKNKIIQKEKKDFMELKNMILESKKNDNEEKILSLMKDDTFKKFYKITIKNSDILEFTLRNNQIDLLM